MIPSRFHCFGDKLHIYISPLQVRACATLFTGGGSGHMTTRQQHLCNFTQKCLDMYRREFSKILSSTDISAINCGMLKKKMT